MFLPIGDTPNPRGTPYVNFLLIGANIAVFLLVTLPLTGARPDLSDPVLIDYLHALGARGSIPAREVLEHISAYDLFVFKYGFRPGEPSLLSLFVAMFLHGGWMHLAGNMLFLWIFGDNVEYRLGRLGYLGVYLATGIIATLFFAFFVPGSQVPLIGASGAISGVLGCYFLWFPRNRVKTFVFLFPFIIDTFLIPARFVLGFYLLVDNLLPFLANAGGAGGVAHGAHIGGFLGGLLVARGVERLPFGRGSARFRQENPRGFAQEGEGADPAERIARLLSEGRPLEAVRLYFSLDGRQGRLAVADEDLLAIGEYLLAAGAGSRALSLFRRFIAERPASPRLDRAYLGAGQALLGQPRSQTGAYHYFLSALDLARSETTAEEARRYLRQIEGR